MSASYLPPGTTVTQVAAVADNGVIGAAGGIPWHSPADFGHFKRITVGHPLVMGRTTFEGIGRPLPDRQSIVVTGDSDWSWDGVLVARSIPEALRIAAEIGPEIMVGGGAGVYRAAMPYATHQVLSLIRVAPEGDTRYPDWEPGPAPWGAQRWRETARERFLDEPTPREIVWLERIGSVEPFEGPVA